MKRLRDARAPMTHTLHVFSRTHTFHVSSMTHTLHVSSMTHIEVSSITRTARVLHDSHTDTCPVQGRGRWQCTRIATASPEQVQATHSPVVGWGRGGGPMVLAFQRLARASGCFRSTENSSAHKALSACFACVLPCFLSLSGSGSSPRSTGALPALRSKALLEVLS